MTMNLLHTEIILYVTNQQHSAAFYSVILCRQPVLNVPGMTEFQLSDTCKLGLMPNESIAKLLKPVLPDPGKGLGIPRCELYWLVTDIQAASLLAQSVNAKMVSPAEVRDWGHRVVYFADPDGHVIAFAQEV